MATDQPLRKLAAMASGAWSDPDRRPEAEPFGTCDWGDCDEYAEAWRWAEELGGWLPVCEDHDDQASDAALSLAWEAASGHDSIATIERVYTRSSSGAYVCIWPGCALARHDPAQLWRHVHSAHGTDGLPPVDFDPGPWL